MNKIAKITALLLILLAVGLPLFAGGAGEAAESEEGSYRFSLAWGPWDVSQGRIDVDEQPDHPWFQYVESQVGVAPLTKSWEWEGGKGYMQGLRLAMAGGEEFEAIMPWEQTFAQEMIEAGRALPLDDLIPNYPNVAAYYPEDVWDAIRDQQGGKIYYIPQPAPMVTSRAGFIRKDWLERVGLDVPTTKEELLEVYRAFKAQDANGNGDPNDEIPVSGREMFRWFDDLFIMHGVSMFEGHPQWSWNEEEGIFESHQVSDAMFEAVKFINQLYDEGLMDVTMPAQPNADWTAKIADNRIGHYFHLINEVHSKSAFAYEAGNDSTGMEHWAVMAHPPIVKGIGKQPYYFPNIQRPRFMITTEARQPEKIMELVNWGSSLEGLTYLNLGIPGVDWERDASGDIVVLNEVQPVHFKYAIGMGDVPEDIIARAPMGELKVQMLEKVKPNLALTENMFMPATVYDGYADFAPNSAPMYREIIGKMITGAVAPTRANWEAYKSEWYAAGGQVVTDRATAWYKEFNEM